MSDRSYRCYLRDANDQVKSVQVITCIDDAEATLRTEALLASSAFPIAELWQDRRLVGKWSNGQ